MSKRTLRDIYGRSYFGSGGAWGGVNCCPNCRTTGDKDNGFVAGPDAVEVIDQDKPARFYARGGDNIGDNGRSWHEEAEYTPGEGWKPPTDFPDNREGRKAWLAAYQMTGPTY